MAIGKKNSQQVVGKLGNKVGYFLNGQFVMRTIGEFTGKPTKKQLSVRQAVKVTSAFLDPLMDFITVGFDIEGRRTKTNAQNQAFSYIRRNAIEGIYPNVHVDFTHVILTLGNIPMPANIKISLDESGIDCTWDVETKVDGLHWADQVMIVAYCESLSKAVFLTAGARRYKGKEHMPIFNMPKGHDLEIYVSFISEDRKRIATSRYMGQLRW